MMMLYSSKLMVGDDINYTLDLGVNEMLFWQLAELIAPIKDRISKNITNTGLRW